MISERPSVATFAVMVEIFLGLITTKALDVFLNVLTGNTAFALRTSFLVVVIVLIVHGFAVVFFVTSNEAYRRALELASVVRVRVFLTITIARLSALYVIADLWARSGETFLVGVTLLSLVMLLSDYLLYRLLGEVYTKAELASRLGYQFAGRMCLADVIFVIVSLVALVSTLRDQMPDRESGSMLALTIIVLTIVIETATMTRAKLSS